ncbi:hypothetical protein [Spiroplasma endosymbiont of Polydrusus formosus]|uniref:hypothetical protein n=1 Tax=Spiroplasma endosymbiont of Polydrusus formosus TaxID=3139326 RepID=UPI0035B500B7
MAIVDINNYEQKVISAFKLIAKFMDLVKLKLFKSERYYLIAKKNSPKLWLKISYYLNTPN